MLTLRDVDKRFGATHAVRSVTFDAAPGQVLGLVGENGAGKSTVIKMLSGVVRPDHGEITLNGRLVALHGASDALRHGIASVFQELTLVRSLTVEQNLLLIDGPTYPWRSLDRRRGHKRAVEILQRYELDMAPDMPVGRLHLGEQQMLEIVRAVERKPAVLLLDEATSALGESEVEWLVGLVNRLRGAGTIVLFISHRWDEIARFCSRVVVMRNGAVVGESDIAALSDEAIRLMTGQSIESVFPAKSENSAKIVLSVRHLRSLSLDEVSLDLRHGEILGVGGLVGQGQGALLEAIFGIHPLLAGAVTVAGKPLTRRSPVHAMTAGIAYVPQERKTEGLLLSKTVGTNMTLAILRRLTCWLGLIDKRLEGRLVGDAIARLQIRARSAEEPIRNLSGGNQQKVLLQKWLFTKPKVLLLNDVTRGVDITTKLQIYELIAEIAGQGVGVVWYSTDTLELRGLAHRVLVMFEGRVNATLTGADITSEGIVRASMIREIADAPVAA
jgi:ribose transport system ATP-binding protein